MNDVTMNNSGLTLLYLVAQAEDRAKMTIRLTIYASRLYDLLWAVLKSS